DIVFAYEEGVACGLGCVLRTVGRQGLVALLDVWSDVDDEGGAHVGVERGIDNLVGAVGSEGLGAFGRRDFYLRQAADEAGFVAEGGGGVVIGMTTLPIGQDDDAGTEAA